MTTTQAPIGTWNSYPAAPVALAWVDSGGNLSIFTFDVVKSETWDEPAQVTEHPVETGANVGDHVRVQLRECKLEVHATNEPIDANQWAVATTGKQAIDVPGPSWAAGPGTIIVPQWSNEIELKSLAGSLVGIAGAVVGNAIGGGSTGGLVGDVAAIAGLEAADLLLHGEASTLPVSTDAGIQPRSGQTIQAQVQQWPGGAAGVDYVSKTVKQLILLKNSAQQIQVIGTKDKCLSMVIEKLTIERSSDTGTGADIAIGFKEIRTVTTQTVPAPIPHLSGGGGKPPQNKGSQNPAPATDADADALLALMRKAAPGWIPPPPNP